MSRIVVDAELLQQLSLTLQTAELVDCHGRVVGHFVPATSDTVPQPALSEAEFQRRESLPNGRFLADILADLLAKS